MDVTSRGCWLLTGFLSLPALCVVVMCESHLQERYHWRQIRYMSVGIVRVELEDLFASCLSLASLSPSAALSFSLPRCRLNLRLFIACSSRAELWVSMLRGRRGCCSRVVHHNLHSFMSLRGKRWTLGRRRRVLGEFASKCNLLNIQCMKDEMLMRRDRSL